MTETLFYGLSGVWDYTNYQEIIPSGYFTRRRMDSSCGDCLYFHTDFERSEILAQPSLNFNTGRYITAISGQSCSQDVRGFKETDFIPEYMGESGVFMPASGDNSPDNYFVSFPLGPCAIRDNPGIQNCNRGFDSLIDSKNEYYPSSTSMSGVKVDLQYLCEGQKAYITDRNNLIYLYDGSGSATNINESFSSLGFSGYSINLVKTNNSIWFPSVGTQRQLIAKYLGGSSETPISKMNIGAGWRTLSYEHNNFWKVYQSGVLIPDRSPSGLYPDAPTCYGISALNIDGSDYLFKNVIHPDRRTYTFYDGNISCSGQSIPMASLSPGVLPIQSGVSSPTPPSTPDDFIDFTLPEFKGPAFLDYFTMHKVGCSGECVIAEPVFNTAYDKFFNKGLPTVKFNYNNRVMYELTGYSAPAGPSPIGSGCFGTLSNCTIGDTGGSGLYSGGDWVTLILSDIGGNVLESPEIEIVPQAISIISSGTAFAAPTLGGGGPCECDELASFTDETTVCSLSVSNGPPSIKFKIQADFSGDTSWILRVINTGSGTTHSSLPHSSAWTFQSFPAKYLIELNNVLSGYSSGNVDYVASADYFDVCAGFTGAVIPGTKQTVTESGIAVETMSMVYGSGIVEFDWT